MAHKIISSPTSGVSDKTYGVDWNKLINHLTGVSATDPLTFNIDQHSLKDSTTNVAGDILKGNGTKFVRFAKGTAGQQIRVNAGGTDLEYFTPGSGVWDPAAVETLTNKTISADSNTITNIDNNDIKAAAAIAYSKLDLVGNIAAADLAINAVTTTKILDSNVTDAKLAQITNKGKQHSATVYNDQDNAFANNEITNARGFMGDVFNGYIWGAYYPADNSTDIALLNNTNTSGTASTAEDADGPYRQFASGATLGTVVGKRKNTAWGRRSQNCLFQARFNVSHATGDIRHCHGFTTDTTSLTNTDTYLGSADSGVMVGFRTTDTNWMVFHNDGTAAMVAVDLGVAKDTAVHKVDIRADAVNNRFVVRFDAVTPVVLTTRIPAATTVMTIRHQAINVTATDINLRMRGLLIGARFI